MLQGFEDGVYMDNTVYIVDEKKQGIPILIRSVQMLYILIGTWSFSSMLIEALDIPCNYFHINLAVLIFSVILYGLFFIPAYDVIKVFFGILFFGLFCYSRGVSLLNGFYIIENLTLRGIDAYYEVESVRFVADYTTQVADTTLLMIMIMIPVMAILTISVMRNRLTAVSCIFLLIPVAGTFALGLVPAERYLIAYVICTTYLISQSHSFRYTVDPRQQKLLHKISSRAAVWLSVMGLFLFFVMKLFVTKEEYNSLTRLQDIKTEMQIAILDFSIGDFLDRISDIELFTVKGTSTGLDGGLLGKTAQVRYENVEHLRITAPTSSIEEGIYLKGYVGSIYTGDRWVGHSGETLKEYEELRSKIPEEAFQPVDQVNLFLNRLCIESEAKGADTADIGLDYSMKEGSMKIKYSKANKEFLYVPYFTNYDLMKDIYYEKDLYVAPENTKDKYEYDYFYQVAMKNTSTIQDSLSKLNIESYAAYEKAYRDFVYSAYTILPKEGINNLKRDFSLERVKTETGSRAEMIAYVKNYLEENTRYSLSPGKLPKGKDFVEYFLYENRVGYCAHYASAATLMLRALGIPARYVEGYAFGKEAIDKSSGMGNVTGYTNDGSTVNSEALSQVSVRDCHAHAWVEVYFDYCGWYPVEFTPGALVSYNQSVIADMERMENNISDAVLSEDLSKNPTAPELPEQYQPITDESLKQNYTSELKQNKAEGLARMDLFYLEILLLTLLVAFILFWGVRFYCGYRNRHEVSLNKRAFTFYHDIEKILGVTKVLPERKLLLEEQEAFVKEHCSYIVSEELDHLMELVRRVRFGRGMISNQELSQIISYRDMLYDRVRDDLSVFQRLKLKILLAI